MNFIGIDIGTNTVCGILYSLDSKQILESLSEGLSFIEPKKEWVQDPLLVEDKVNKIINKLIDKSSTPVKGISFSSQMHGIVYINKEGEPITPFYTWLNTRGNGTYKMNTYHNYATTILGYKVYAGYGLLTHLSLRDKGDLPEKISQFCSIGDFITMRLCGNKRAKNGLSLGSSLGIIDPKTKEYSDQLEVLDPDILSLLPDLTKESLILGTYRDIPVIQAIGDNQASFIGSVQDYKSSLLLNYGTAGQLSFYSDEKISYRGFEPRFLGWGYLYTASSLSAGYSYNILINFFKSVITHFTDCQPDRIYELVDNLDISHVTLIPDCHPQFLGDRFNSDDKAFIGNLTKDNFTVEGLIKGFARGVAKELWQSFEQLPLELHGQFTKYIGSGNGLRKNPHLKEALEQITHNSIVTVRGGEESAKGAVIHGLYTLGEIESYQLGSLELIQYD